MMEEMSDKDARVVINKAEELLRQTWNTEELQRDFTVEGFLAPFVVVRRKSDGVRGTLEFTHSPRVYYKFVPDLPWV